MKKYKQVILYFDGVCSLCNSTIDFFIRKDKSDIFKYSALQGRSASQNLDPSYISNLNTVVLYVDGEIFVKSKAILKALSILGRPYSFLGILGIIPSFITDFFYNLISKYRYKIFGKKQTCRLPSKSEQKYFLE